MGVNVNYTLVDGVLTISGTIEHTTLQYSDWPWYSERDNITSVIIEAGTNFSVGSNASRMFYNCRSLTSLDLSNLDTSNVTSMALMFSNCYLLTSLDLSNFNTSSVTSMAHMFSSCSSLTSLDLSNFNTSSVTSMVNMFGHCTSLTSLDLPSNFNTSNVTSMHSMFSDCRLLTSLDLPSNFDTSNVTHMESMFSNCRLLTSLDLSNFNTSSVTNMASMFSNCRLLTSLDLSNFNTSSVTDMSYMFDYCTSLKSLDLSSNFNTSNVTDIEGMFGYCSLLTSLDLSNFDTSKVTNTSDMFYNCNKLQAIYVNDNKWDISVAFSSNMFTNCLNLVGENGTTFNSSHVDKTYARIDTASTPGYLTNYILETGEYRSVDYTIYRTNGALVINETGEVNTFSEYVSGSYPAWRNNSNIKTVEFKNETYGSGDFSYMFYNLSNATSIDLSNFYATNITSMSYMFRNCSSLIELNLLHFTFSTNENCMMWNTFENCRKLQSLYLPILSNVYLDDTFRECINLSCNIYIDNNINIFYHLFYNTTQPIYILNTNETDESASMWRNYLDNNSYDNVHYGLDDASWNTTFSGERGTREDDVWTTSENGSKIHFTYNTNLIPTASSIPYNLTYIGTTNVIVDIETDNVITLDEYNDYTPLDDKTYNYRLTAQPSYSYTLNGTTYTLTTSTTALTSVIGAFALVDFLAGGLGMAIGGVADRKGLDITFPTSIGEGLVPSNKYEETSDSTYNSEKTYYVESGLDDGSYTEALISDGFEENVIYYENQGIDLNNYQLIVGKYNKENVDAAFIIGNGTLGNTSNAFVVDSSGNLTVLNDFKIKITNETTVDTIMNLSGSNISVYNPNQSSFYYNFAYQSDPNNYGETTLSTYSLGDTCLYEGVKYVYTNETDSSKSDPFSLDNWSPVINDCSFACGWKTSAGGRYSVAEGWNTATTGDAAHAEGGQTYALGSASHSEGGNHTLASGAYAHAEGSATKAYGYYSHSQNLGTIAAGRAQTVMGTFNVEDAATTTTHSNGNIAYKQYALIIGNGAAYNSRSNALTVDWNGNVVASGTFTDGTGNTLTDFDTTYPVGSCFVTSLASQNPNNLFPGTSWSLIDKQLRSQWITSGFTFNTTNTQSGTFTAIPSGHSIELRIYWANKTVIGNTDITIGTLNYRTIGLSSAHEYYGVAYADGLDAIGMMKMELSGTTGTLKSVDWVTRSTSYSTNTDYGVCLTITINERYTNFIDSFCSSFTWKRTA